MTRKEATDLLLKRPYKLGHVLGFTRLTELHNNWIIEMVRGTVDRTLQAHRGSYKTTCVSIALAIIMVLLPNYRTLFMRKTDDDVKEVIKQVKKILESPHMQCLVMAIYGVELKLTVDNSNELSTNLTTDIKGTSQLVGMGLGSSLTGKHFDFVFTDDIVNVNDRISKAERDRTKQIYQELQNVKNRGGRIFNTGTPWHKDDAFTLMPNAEKYDCYSTGLISAEELSEIKAKMVASLFAANYELRHIASEDVIFTDPQTGADIGNIRYGNSHIDAAYGGEDYTAMTIFSYHDGKYYLFGKLWHKHVDSVLDDVVFYHQQNLCGRMDCEDNGDKGYLARDLKARGIRVHRYHENMNKFLKITSYLKFVWNDVIFVAGTDAEYIDMICDYNEHAEHDDAPDSAASSIRILTKKDGVKVLK